MTTVDLEKRLRHAILRGEWAPGTRLPSERDLAAEHGVSRSTVRSALARLEEARLVEIRHGSGCRVLDPDASEGAALLDKMLDAARREREDVGQMAEDLLDLRRVVAGVILERLASRPVAPSHARALREAVDRLEAVVDEGGTVAAIGAADLAAFAAMIDATRSLVFRLCLGPVARVLTTLPGLREAIYAEPKETVVGYRLLLAWLENDDPKRVEMVRPILDALAARDRAAVRLARIRVAKRIRSR